MNFNKYKKVSNPVQYLGLDINSVHKNFDSAKVKFLLAFPDLYQIASSNLGTQILYNIINKHEYYLCDKIFAPDVDMMNMISNGELPYLSLYSRREALDFDIIGFSLQYELSFTTVLKMLELMGIPLYARDRVGDDSIPIICAGGPVVFNPLPVASFFDFFLIGDGEEAVIEKCEIIDRYKGCGKSKIIEELSKIDGVYTPLSNKKIVKKRFITNFKPEDSIYNPIVPLAKSVHERCVVEISRGCTRGCRFCQAGMIYRPVREKNILEVLNTAKESIKNSGYDECSILSLSVGDYSLLEELILGLKYLDSSISLPSIRADKINDNILKILSERERTGFTIAPEAGSERLRAVINKNLTEQDIEESVTFLFKNGWNLIKLYFMIGLPYERFEDVEDIVKLSFKIAKIGRSFSKNNRINVSISTFIPKPHTPFQWFGQENIDSIKSKLRYLKDSFKKGKNINLKWHTPEMSLLEAVLSRGDRDVERIIYGAYKNGAYLDSWGDKFDYKLWVQSSDSEQYLLNKIAEKNYLLEDELPWDFIDIGVSKAFLKKEYLLAVEGLQTPDCRFDKCSGCGVCSGELKNIFSEKIDKEHLKIHNNFITNSVADDYKRVIFEFEKLGASSLLGQIDTTKLILKGLKNSSAKYKYSEGFKPKLKITQSPPAPFGVASKSEFFEVYISQCSDFDKLVEGMNKFFSGIIVIKSYFENINKINLMRDVKASVYSVKIAALPPIEDELIESIEKVSDKFYINIKYLNGKHLNIKKFLDSALKDFISPEEIDLIEIRREKFIY